MGTLRHRLAYAATMFVVCGLSLLLLIYVGLGEAQRTYPTFHFEKLAAQGRIVQNAMDAYLRAGLPVRQFVGFNGMAEDILTSDPTIAQIAVFDSAGQPVFVAGREGKASLLAVDPRVPASMSGTRYEHGADAVSYQVALPLRSRFEVVGWVAVSVPRAEIAGRLDDSFRLPLLAVAVLSLAFAVFATVAAPRVAGRRVPWLQIGYLVTFAGMALLVIGQLVALYADGAQAKSKALAASLGQRLNDIFEYNLSLSSFDGLDKVFADYRRLNPDIAAAGLTVDGVVRFHTNSDAVGKPWASAPGDYEFSVDIEAASSPRRVGVTVALPGQIVTQQVTRSAKNFAALFVATGFLASLFLQLAGAVHMRRRVDAAAPGVREQEHIDVVRPVFFVAMFVEHLTYSFLPQFAHAAVEQAGLPPSLASSPFLLYYICFALTLVPAGYLSRRFGARRLMYCGLLLSACGVLSLAAHLGFGAIALGRALSGIGQGMLFIGVQSYILAVSSPERRTQGAAIIVFGFQGGMIAGTAIGSLLVTYMGPNAVFLLAGVLGLASAVYTLLLVPTLVVQPLEAAAGNLVIAVRHLARDIAEVVTSGGFLKAILMIGVPAKAVLTGIVVFALPLILAQRQYPQDDIGQIIMVYGICVLLASSYASRLVDRTGRSGTALAWGAAASGLGLVLIGLSPATLIGGVMLIAGVAVVGLAHGCINAPIVTHVAELDIANRIGIDSATAAYRFLERVGHAIGPVLVAQLLFFSGQGSGAVAWVGAAVVVLGLLFALRTDPGSSPMHKGASA
jgi:predicted MFS family arabinose efflux permease